MDNAIEIARVRRDDQVDIIVRKGDFMGHNFVDIREYLNADSFEGFTKRGLRIPSELFLDLEQQLHKVVKQYNF